MFNIIEYRKEYYQTNKDKLRLKRKEYYQRNKDKIKEYNQNNREKINLQKKEYRQKNKDKIKLKQKEYYQKHPEIRKEYRRKNKEKIKLQQQQYQAKNKTQIKTQRQIFYNKNKKRVLDRGIKYRAENKDKLRKYYNRPDIKIKKQKYHKILHMQKKIKVYNHYSNYDIKCNCCGERQIEFLSLDHINNDGIIHRKSGIANMVNWVVKNNYPSGFQLLCMNCNFAKGHNQDHICPHQKQLSEQILEREI